MVLDQGDVGRLLEGTCIPVQALPPQALSDVARARLLRDQGGLWVDASVFPVKPLDRWLGPLLTPAGFFAFERPGPDRPLSSWLLAATPGHPILRAWWSEIERFWSKPRRLNDAIPADPAASVSRDAADRDEYPYYWFHYLFQWLLETDPDVAAAWDRCAKLSAAPPHALQDLFGMTQAPTIAEILQAAARAPVQKLNWRMSFPLEALASLT